MKQSKQKSKNRRNLGGKDIGGFIHKHVIIIQVLTGSGGWRDVVAGANDIILNDSSE